jgi:hypothetical protein
MPRKQKAPPIKNTPIELGSPHPAEAEKGADETRFDLNDIDSILGDVPAPRTKEKPEPGAAPETKEKKPTDAAKKEASRLKFIREHPQTVQGAGLLFKGGFAIGAMIAKEKMWNLTDEEVTELNKAWQPVLELYGPEWLLKIFPVIGAVVVTGQIVTKKGAAIQEKKEKERDVKIKAEMDKTQKLIDDMRIETAKWEARQNAEQGNRSVPGGPLEKPGQPFQNYGNDNPVGQGPPGPQPAKA